MEVTAETWTEDPREKSKGNNQRFISVSGTSTLGGSARLHCILPPRNFKNIKAMYETKTVHSTSKTVSFASAQWKDDVI